MRYRKAEILSAVDYDTAQTKSYDITLTDIISRITILSKLKKSVNEMTDHPVADITKVELVDGSDVLFSLNGKEAQGVNIYDRPKAEMNRIRSYANLACEALIGLDFGRYLFDEVLAFDPGKFKNPQLKITFTLTTSDAAGTPMNLKILADVFDERVPTPKGFLLNKEFYEYTPSTVDSYEPINLPTDYVLRKLFLRPYLEAYRPWDVVKEARLDENNLKRVPLDLVLEDYYLEMLGVWPKADELLNTSYNPGDTVRYVTPCDEFAYISKDTGAVSAGYHTGYLRGGKITWHGPSPGEEHHGRVIGHCPHHMLEFAFGDPLRMEDWYDVTKVGTLRLRLKAGAQGSSGKCAVVTQQYRPY